MAEYETKDPNSLDQVHNQSGFDDQSDDQSNYGGGDQEEVIRTSWAMQQEGKTKGQ